MVPDTPRSIPLKVKAGLLLLWLAGLAGVALWSLEPPDPRPADVPLEQFSAARALPHVRALAARPHPVGTPSHDLAGEYIVQQLRRLGLSPLIQTAAVVANGWQRPYRAASIRNVWARLPGHSDLSSVNKPALLLVAHYDSVPTGPGASDDTASAAALLETARALLHDRAAHGPPLNDIALLWTDGEEAGLFGAKAFVEKKGSPLEAGTKANAPVVQSDPLPPFSFRPFSFFASRAFLVLNFEARGVSGPSLLFETGAGNGALIRQFAQAAPQPTASSLFYAVYKILPNDSDFTEFKKAGMRGLNFAFIDGLSRYHTALDDIARLNAGSLQQQGDIMLGMARRVGDALPADAVPPVPALFAPASPFPASFASDKPASASADAIFFNVTRATLAVYPEAWAVPLAVVATLLTVALLLCLVRRGVWTGWGVISGLLYCAMGVAAGMIAGIAPMRLLPLFAPAPRSTLYTGNAALIGTILLAFGLAWGLWTRAAGRSPRGTRRGAARGTKAETSDMPAPDSIMAGAILTWLCLAWLTALGLPGGSYLFVWPLAFTLIAEFLFVLLPARSMGEASEKDGRDGHKQDYDNSRDDRNSRGQRNRRSRDTAVFAARMIGAAPALLLMVPVLRLLFSALSLTALPVVGALVALCAGLLRPNLLLLSQAAVMARPLRGAIWSGGLGLVLIGAATGDLRPTTARPQFDSVFYALNADTKRAVWASDDAKPDAWTTQFLGPHPERGPLSPFLPVSPARFLHAPAPLMPLAPPVAILQSERHEGAARVYAFHIVSPRHAPLVEIAAPDALVVDATIEGQAVGGNEGLRHAWSLLYFNVPAGGITLTLRVRAVGHETPLALRVIDRSYGLPEIAGHPHTPRPDTILATPAPGWYQDTVLVGKTYRF